MVESEKYSDVQVGGGDIGIVPAANDSSSTNVTPAANDSTPVAGFILINDDEIKKLRVDGLRKELKARGINATGLKPELLARLRKAMVDKVAIATVTNDEPGQNNVFGDGVMWKRLEPLPETLANPNEENTFRAPTAGESGVEFVTKRNFAETFDHAPFIGSIQSPMLDRFKR